MQIRAQLLWLGAGSPSFVQVSGKAMCVESLSRELSEKWCECERGSGAPELFQGSALLLRTGSGKTLAFALPYLSMSRSRKGGRKQSETVKGKRSLICKRRKVAWQAWRAGRLRAALRSATLRGYGTNKATHARAAPWQRPRTVLSGSSRCRLRRCLSDFSAVSAISAHLAETKGCTDLVKALTAGEEVL